MEQRFSRIKDHTRQFSLIVGVFASAIEQPIIYDSGIEHWGFRYMKPTAMHFCMLKSIRAVSALNATIVLAEKGFNQEVCVLMRTIVECTSQIEFILSGLNNDGLNTIQQKFIDNFFDDFRRNDSGDFKGKNAAQKDIHNEIERFLNDLGVTGDTGRFPTVSTSHLMSNVYRNFSNYVHARYPEIMDMYGGTPRRFHLNGMSGTPKDQESLAIIEHFTDSVAIVLGLMIQKFDMRDAVLKVPELAHWFKTITTT